VALVIVYPEPLFDDTLKINPAPPNHTVYCRVGAGLNDSDEFGFLLFR
jgi:hypothetical protein